ncbi:hypothetical protein COMNV_00873 [Commensalibacter sp. Nvir]|uniref:hypothetical protein n=1 Tax=Commensalibacter sp. Nvir TaxID=3069817 RepID=UPI002D37BFB9|nr:hypothetical protein COMNV_00873 [Commensalibacter sp. Nvir]
MALARPTPFLSKWAENGKRFDVPDSGGDIANGKADIQTGFPEITMTSVLKGGVPPWGQDHNGILYQITQSIQWMQAGGLGTFDQDLCNKTGGYPVGAIVQSSDTTKPWVLWQNLQDGNTVDPNGLKINNANPQQNWVRYPVISVQSGSILYFDDDGKLQAASPTITTIKYVSSSLGSDDTGDGSKDKPFFSIAKAIEQSPGSGAITIYLYCLDNHYWSPDGKSSQSDGEYLDIGSRKIKFQPYDKNDKYFSIETDMANRFRDGTNAFCLSNTYLSSIGLGRPKITLVWMYVQTWNGTEMVTTYTQFCGCDGTKKDFSLQFFGVEFVIDRVDELSREDLNLTAGWGANGGEYNFIGCIFNSLPHTGVHFLLGGAGNYDSSYTFDYSNFFTDSPGDAKLAGYVSTLSLFVGNDAEEYTLTGTDYVVMKSNQRTFISSSKSWYDGLDIIQTPSPRYALINPNIEIK